MHNRHIISEVYSVSLPSYVNNFDIKSGNNQEIYIEISATHTGYVNKNFYWYNSDDIKRDMISFLKPYPKPIVTGHEFEDPNTTIGRVVTVDFVSLPKLNVDDIYSPEGFVKVIAKITDFDAIKKILDQRFLTVSIGGESSNVFCSICNEQITDPFEHEHIRGKEYDGKLAYWIVKGIEYTQIAFVNTPADSYASVQAVLSPEEYVNKYSEYIMENKQEQRRGSNVFLIDMQTKKGGNMKPKENDKKDHEETTDIWYEDFSDLDITAEDFEELNTMLEAIESEIESLSAETTEESDTNTKTEDKKLSYKARKKLPKSVFCGPPRPGHKEKGSFPVPDCLHARVAKAYLKRSKFSAAVKKRIYACIVRREKALGCKTKDNVDTDQVNLTIDNLKVETKKIVTDLYEQKITDLSETLEKHASELEKLRKVTESLSKKIELLQKKIDESAKDEDLIDSLNIVTSENEVLNKKLVDSYAKIYAILNVVLKKESTEDVNEIADNIKKESVANIKKAIDDLEKEFSAYITDRHKTKKKETKDDNEISLIEFFNKKD